MNMEDILKSKNIIKFAEFVLSINTECGLTKKDYKTLHKLSRAYQDEIFKSIPAIEFNNRRIELVNKMNEELSNYETLSEIWQFKHSYWLQMIQSHDQEYLKRFGKYWDYHTRLGKQWRLKRILKTYRHHFPELRPVYIKK